MGSMATKWVLTWVNKREKCRISGSSKDPLGLSCHEFKVRPVAMAVCVSPVKSDTLRGMRRDGPASLPDGGQSCFVLYFKKGAPKEALALEPRDVQSTSQSKYFAQVIRLGVSCLSQFSWPWLLNLSRLLCFFLAFSCNQRSLNVYYEDRLMCDTAPVL